MMNENVYISEQHIELRKQIARFLKENVEPDGVKWEKEGYVPRKVIKKLGELGLLGITYSDEYGGANADIITSLVFQEALSRSTFGGFVVTILVHTDMASPHLVHSGNEEQKKKYLPKIINGDLVTAVAVSEPDIGSDVASLKTTAKYVDNKWILNGSKLYITNGVHGDLFFVAARTGELSSRASGISMFMVEKGTPGFMVAKSLKKQGWNCSDTAELFFENCEIPNENLLGEKNKGFYEIMKNFQTERIALGAMAIGHCLTALELTLEWIKSRKTFGGVLFEKQVIRNKLAMLFTKVQSARTFLYHCAWLAENNKDCVQEVSALKALTGELVNEVMYSCQQYFGGMGYMSENSLERLVRDSRILSIGGGATEIMLEEVAKRFPTKFS